MVSADFCGRATVLDADDCGSIFSDMDAFDPRICDLLMDVVIIFGSAGMNRFGIFGGGSSKPLVLVTG